MKKTLCNAVLTNNKNLEQQTIKLKEVGLSELIEKMKDYFTDSLTLDLDSLKKELKYRGGVGENFTSLGISYYIKKIEPG